MISVCHCRVKGYTFSKCYVILKRFGNPRPPDKVKKQRLMDSNHICSILNYFKNTSPCSNNAKYKSGYIPYASPKEMYSWGDRLSCICIVNAFTNPAAGQNPIALGSRSYH